MKTIALPVLLITGVLGTVSVAQAECDPGSYSFDIEQ
jgi:hypothetical protein